MIEKNRVVYGINELLKGITGFSGEYYILDSKANVYNLYGERLFTDDSQKYLNKVKEEIDRKRACAIITKDKFNFIYLPNYSDKMSLNLEELLTISEEVFHIQSSTSNNHVSEALALLGRYFVWRCLNDEFRLIPNLKDKRVILDKLVGGLVVKAKKKKGGCNQYFILSDERNSVDEVANYFGRIWLIGLVKKIDELSLDDALKEIKDLYTKIKEESNQIKLIEEQGLIHKTTPYMSFYERNIRLLMGLNCPKYGETYGKAVESIKGSSIAMNVNNYKPDKEKKGFLDGVFKYFTNCLYKKIERLNNEWGEKWLPLLKDNEDFELRKLAEKELDENDEKEERLYNKIKKLNNLEFKLKKSMIILKNKISYCPYLLKNKFLSWKNKSDYIKEFNKNLEDWLSN